MRCYFKRLERVDPGIDTHNTLSFGAFLPESNYPERSDVRAFWNEALERMRALPGVQSATAGNARPPSQIPMTNNFNLEDKPTPASESQPSVPWSSVMPDYFDVLSLSVSAPAWWRRRSPLVWFPPDVPHESIRR